MFAEIVLFYLLFNSKLFDAANGKTLKLGAIFDRKDEIKENALQLCISEMNDLRWFDEDEVKVIIKDISKDNPYEAWIATCELLEEGIIGMIGPNSEDNSNVVQSICDAKEIPQLEVRWDDQPLTDTIVNIYPYQEILIRLYKNVIDECGWKEFVILYENNDSLKRVGGLLEMYDKKNHQIVVRQLDKDKSGNYRLTLKEVWASGATNFLIDCTVEILEEVLRQAQQIGLMTDKQEYVITNLDLHTVDLTSFQYGGTKITGMRFINPESKRMRDLASRLLENVEFASWKVQLETVLLTDIIMMYAGALQELSNDFDIPSLSCNSTDSWIFGTSLLNFMKRRTYNGLTGNVKFDNVGYRSDFSLEITELKEGGIAKVGEWSSSKGLNMTTVVVDAPPNNDLSLANKSFTIIISLTEPYAMLKESPNQLFGNDAYEGYAIDLIEALSTMEGFNYTFIERKDKSNGAFDLRTEKWTGMIGDVMYEKADLAIADLTITSDREEAVDFTTPFMNLGISILYQEPTKANPSFFSFAEPFALSVWKLLAVAYIGASVSLFIMGRITPGEWTNPYPCIEEPEYLVNQLSFANCLWFNIGSLMQQGCDFAPIAVSTRIVSGMWWFFVVIIVACYTANLAACLTSELPDPQFDNVYELLKVADKFGIKYGAKKNGATQTFFKESTNPVFKEIYSYMVNHEDEVMMPDNKDGVIKAENETYAFFMESTSIEYEIERKCNLQQVGKSLDEKGYGIATRKNTSYSNILTSAILKLQQSGELEAIKRKWWKERRGGGQCGGSEESNEAEALDLKNVGGVFWVTIIGTVLSFFVVIVEMGVHIMNIAIKTKIPFRTILVRELKFIFKFSKMEKPVADYYVTEEENTNSEEKKSWS